ncbi:hypothetical protein Tco_1241333, partial [Tanacetum coccineum]
VGADNRPPMLDKTNYSSWASRMLLYIKGKEHGKLLVDSVLNGLFQYGATVEPGNENTPATVRARTYTDLTEHANQIWDRVKLLIQGLELSLQQRESKLYDDFDMFISSLESQSIHITCVVHQQPYQAPALQQSYQAPAIQQPLQPSSRELDLGLVVPSFNPSDDHIANLNKLMVFGARNIATNQGANRNGATGQERVIKCYNSQKEDNGDTVTPVQSSQEISSPTAFQTDALDAFDSDCDDAPSTKEVFMTNLSSYDSDVLSEVIVDRNAKESKDKEDKYTDEIIDLQKKNKALGNVVYKMGQSTQHAISHRKVPALYDGHTIVKKHDALTVTDTEETLELAEESRLKMLAKQNNETVKEKKVNIAHVDYVALNKLSDHFVKHFVPQKQLSAEQEFWLPISQHHIICQDVMNIAMHADSLPVNLLPANNKYIVHICVNSLATRNNFCEMQQSFIDAYNENLVLMTELAIKKENMVEKKFFDEVNLKGKNVVEKDATSNNAKVIAPRMFKLDLEPLSPKVLKNRDAHIDYIEHTQENADILWELVEHARALRPFDSDLYSACKNEEFY